MASIAGLSGMDRLQQIVGGARSQADIEPRGEAIGQSNDGICVIRYVDG
jgi:hypothetical protein